MNDISEFAQALQQSKNATLLVGAGISRDMEIPGGYDILFLYCEMHIDLIRRIGLRKPLDNALNGDTGEAGKFAKDFASKFEKNVELQESFIDWISHSEDERIAPISGAKSYIHAAIVVAWLNRVFSHLITTNWDFLLESQLEDIYLPPKDSDKVFPSPFDPVKYSFEKGQFTTISPDNLYFLRELGGDKFSWQERRDIISNRSDLENLHN